MILARALLAGVVTATLFARPARADCFDDVAATRGYSLGAPRHFAPTPDRRVLYLRSGPRETTQRFFEFDPTTGQERERVRPDSLLGGAGEQLSAEERARRERARVTTAGFTDFALSPDGARVLLPLGDRLFVLTRATGAVTTLPGRGWIAPKLSPDGQFVAAVRDNDLRVVGLDGTDTAVTAGGSETLTRGVPDFAASEEFDRDDGAWWSPDGALLAYEEADLSGVEQHFIADPLHPATPPTAFRYPRAGTANAAVRIGVVPRGGGATTWLTWDHDAYPYVARVVWPARGPLSVVLLDRAQTREVLLAADPATGATTALLTETDPAWVDLAPAAGRARDGASELPRWLDDGAGFLWATESGGAWRLDLHRADGSFDHTVTPPSHPFQALADVGPDGVTFAASPDRLGRGVYRVPLAGGTVVPVADAPGLHTPTFAADHAVFVDNASLADGTRTATWHDGDHAVALPNEAETPPAPPRVTFQEVGPRALDTALVLPRDFRDDRKYPVILAVYAGPTVKVVERAPRLYFADQCMADEGAIVVGIDGRGTPGRGRDWARAIKGNFIDVPLADQIDGLRALAATVPAMDLSRVGVTGWSFGGYFTAMATIRRPDVFAVGAAGAPGVDWADYDTAYTERYLGLPDAAPEAYRVSNVLTYAPTLARPLLLLHGLTDDNVYFQHTVKLTQALLRAGKPYDLILLTGTHLLPDPVVRAAVERDRTRYLLRHLGPT